MFSSKKIACKGTYYQTVFQLRTIFFGLPVVRPEIYLYSVIDLTVDLRPKKRIRDTTL